MQVPVDHRGGDEPAVPVGGGLRPAPLGEDRVAQHLGRVAVQRPVVHQHRGQRRVPGRQPAGGRVQPGRAPLLPARVRVGMQQELVGADDPRPVRLRQGRLPGVEPRRSPAVVVEQEQRGHQRGTARPPPHPVVVLGGDHAQLPAPPHQQLVAGHPAQGHRVGRRRPQLVVAGCPDDGVEAFREQAERPLDVGHGVRHVTGDDQPVPWRSGPQRLDQGTILRVPDVQVADRDQTALDVLPQHPPIVRRSSTGAGRAGARPCAVGVSRPSPARPSGGAARP